jgi:hypothetical protein
MPRGGDTSKRARDAGKQVGRPPKPKIELKANKGIATEVLAMDGPPDHIRKCKCDLCLNRKALCSCVKQCADCSKLKANCECEQYREITIKCRTCRLVEEHKVCHCEHCGWWEALLSRDLRLRKETRQYLTDRRDGKPAQGVFIGDTRENVRDLDFGDLPELIAPGESRAAGKPN